MVIMEKVINLNAFYLKNVFRHDIGIAVVCSVEYIPAETGALSMWHDHQSTIVNSWT